MRGTTPVVIPLDGVKTGKIEVVAKAPKPLDPAYVSGECGRDKGLDECLLGNTPVVIAFDGEETDGSKV